MATGSDGGDKLDMVARINDVFAALCAPFHPDEVKTRTQAGRTFSYVTARSIMNRLDDVVGPANWWDEFVPGEHSVMCRLSLRLPDGSVITKTDAGGYAGMGDSGDDDKSGYSDGYKRAAVKFGLGRYLYRDGVPNYAVPYFSGADAQFSGAQSRSDATPARPSYQNGGQGQSHGGGNGGGQQQGGGGDRGGPPRSGKALFAWSKSVEEKHQVGMLKYLNEWAKLQGFPGRMVDWDASQVALAYAEGSRKLKSQGTGGAGGERGDAYEEALANF